MAVTDIDTRFSLLELDLPTEVKAERIALPTPKPVAPIVPINAWASPGHSTEGEARAKADEKAALDAGFSPKPPIYQIGSLVNAVGVDNFRASREEFEAMPTAYDACGKLASQVQAEDRQDLLVPVKSLTMLPDGRLTRGQGTMTMSHRAMEGLGVFVTPGGASYLRQCPTELRAINVNHWCQANGQRIDRKGRTVDREITLRTRLNATLGKRETFAVVGPKYSAHDVDKLAEQIMRSPAIPADARADVVYDGYKARINVLFHTNVQPEKAVAGEIFKAGLLFRTADDGSGSIQVAAQVFRNLCLNLIVIDHAKEMVVRRSHRGEGIARAVEAGIHEAMEKVAYFADKWSEATLENVLEKYGCQDIEQVMRGLVVNKVVTATGVRAPDMFQRLMDAWQKEPGYSKTSIVNAVTRAAHENPWSHWETVEELETLGGQLLYAKNWNVAIEDSAQVDF